MLPSVFSLVCRIRNVTIWFLRRKTEEERQKKEDEKARREFIRQEYMRRKQLKLMEDMDTVIKPRPQIAKPKKQRPKSIHRDHIESPKTPIKGPPGNTAYCEESVHRDTSLVCPANLTVLWYAALDAPFEAVRAPHCRTKMSKCSLL